MRTVATGVVAGKAPTALLVWKTNALPSLLTKLERVSGLSFPATSGPSGATHLTTPSCQT